MAGDYNLGTARGVIELDYNGNKAGERARSDMDSIAKSGDRTKAALDKTGTGMLVAGAAIVGGLGLAVKSASDFEKGLSGIKAVSAATTTQMDDVRKKALQLGADTSFSAGEAASAMEELVKAGIPIPDVLNGAADATVSLAAAGGIDLPAAATIAANAMNQFGLSAKEMPNIADKIAGAANASAIDVTDFGNSMTQAGAVAHLVGLNFDDTALAITAMGNAGVKGSDAGTSLKTFLTNLQPTTEKQTGLMEELGLITKEGGNQFFTAAGKIKPMSEIAGVLGKSLKGMSDAQKTATLSTLFGSDAIRAAAVIAGQGSEGMDKLSKSIDKVKAADVAKTRMDNLAGSFEALKGSAETMAIGLGSVLLPMLKALSDQMTSLVNWFVNLSPGMQKALVIGLVLAGGLLILVGGIIKTVQAAQALKATMILLNGTFLANPIFLIIAAIIALIAIFVALYKNNESFRNFVNAMWAGIQAAIQVVVSWITSVAVPWIVNAWNAIVAATQSLWARITSIWNAISSVVSTVFAFIVRAVTTYVNLVRTVITTAVNTILAVWRAVWGLFGPLIKAVFDLIVAVIQLAMRIIKLAISTAWNFIYGVVSTSVNRILSIVTSVFNAVKSFISSVFNSTKSAVSSIWNAIYGVIETPVNKARSIVDTVFNAIKTLVTNVWGSLSGIAKSAWDAMTSAISTAINTAKERVSGVVETIKGFFSGAGTWLRDAGAQLIGGLIEGIRSMIGKVAGAISSITDKIKGFLPGSPIKEGPLVEWNGGTPGKKLVKMLASGIAANVGMLDGAFAGVDLGLPTALTTPTVAVAASTSRTGSNGTISTNSGSDRPSVYAPVTVNAPQSMSPDQVARATAARLGYALSGSTTPIPSPAGAR